MELKVLLQCSQAPSTGPIMSQMNPVHTIPPYFFKIYFNIIRPTNGISTLSWWWGLRAPETLRAMPAVA
jgi:hypothetical protein